MNATRVITAIVAAAALAAGTGACGTTVMRVVHSHPIGAAHQALHAEVRSELSRWYAPSTGVSHPRCENPATKSDTTS
jgi:hypothetical protein